jgi:hypothetical protein
MIEPPSANEAGETQNAATLLAMADAFARELVASALPVRYRVAERDEEREAIYRLRNGTVVALGWAEPDSMPEGVERDQFDADAMQVGGWDGEELIACARVVFPTVGRPLPTEEAFRVEVSPRGEVVDVGRGIVAPAYRDEGRRIFMGLLATCWLELHGRGFSRMCGDAGPWLIDVYRGMGFQVEVLGEGRPYWGELREPILIDGLASVRSVIDRLGGETASPESRVPRSARS